MKKIVCLALSAILALGLTACGSSGTNSGSGSNSSSSASSSQAAKGSISIKYSTWATDGEAAYEGMKKFKELVEDGSDGVITVDLYPSNTAGATDEQVEQVSMNQLQMMSSGDPGITEIEYLCLPYLFSDLGQYEEFLSSDLGKQYIQQSIDTRNTRILGLLPRSPRIISCNTPINSLADMKGLKIRVPTKDYYVDTFTAFGANPTPIDMGDVYSSIQTGVVDGQENPIETIVSYGFQNICKYLVITDHIVKPAFVMINNDFYTGLSDEYQKLIDSAVEESCSYAEDYLETAMEKDMKTCTDAGMTVLEPDLTGFKEATQSVRDKLGVQTWGEDGYKQVLEIANNG
ncbi:putative transporter [Oscillibacter valericigenes Sjm18-20]|nr:putative transporter [Oscillibacter valericigenes Sjm18-20]